MRRLVAHPDDLEYGASAAIARWTAQGKDIRYVLATRGEAGIDSMAPERAGPLRTQEQIEAAAAVGVDVVEFLDHPDLKGKPGLAKIFAALDTNSDGKTTTPEYLRVWGQWARTKPAQD